MSVELAPVGIGMPPVGIPRPVAIRSRMNRLMPARIFKLVSAMYAAEPVMATASLNVVMAVPITTRLMVVAISNSASVKPASEVACVRMMPFRLREVRDVRRQYVSVRVGAVLVRDRDRDRSQVCLDVRDLNLTCEVRQRHGDVIGSPEPLIATRQIDAFN